MKATRQIKTILGRIRFTASITGDDTARSRLSLEVFPYDPKLLKEHSVQRSRAILLRAKVANESQLEFECELEGPIQGQPASGQYLDAQEWIYKSSTVAIGTDDAEMLEMRFPQISLVGASTYPVEYRNNGFKVTLRDIPKGQHLSLHFSVVEKSNWNPEDESAFFAAEISHENLLTAAVRHSRRQIAWLCVISILGFAATMAIWNLGFPQPI